MDKIYKLKGQSQHYVWGGKNYIPTLLNIPNHTNQCYAEWWLGTHNSAPSIIESEQGELLLNEFIVQNPTALGQKKLANTLPYLLKILDVEKPLSIQLHPTKQQAETGFIRENAKGIPLTDSKRTYKDNNHKPEMMIALSDFWLLHGFNHKEKIIATLKKRPSLTALAEQLTHQNLDQFYAHIMQAEQAQLFSWLHPIIIENKTSYQHNQLSLNNPDYWVLYTIEAMEVPLDKLDAGLICFYLFNIVQLKKGEGIYQDAGIPHAYLRGQNIELMSCSDNVIRGGLTPKHVDIAELLKIIDCHEINPKIIPPAPKTQSVFTYVTPARDFALTNIRYKSNQKLTLETTYAEILLIMEGEVKIYQNNTTLTLKKGEAAFICADTDYQIHGITSGYAVIAKQPE
ncbi:mannose-6-phosphate isomerase, class I [Seminibacterium arietis]|uniref:mannose-6-phosphate isomerase n=1 Tax=Seminibacterium arietis TaxID=1173502 RepID=A0ABW3IAJ3_9PAST